MRRNIAALCLLTLLPIAALTACERIKSASPLSPSIAGPIAGVEISAPRTLAPANNARIAADNQPITFVVENASSNGVRPLSYLFEIATDIGFVSKVYTQQGVPPGEDGTTSLRLPHALQSERNYYWRVKAQDGANTGEYSSATSFEIFTPVVIGIASLRSPGDGATIDTRRPTLEWDNAPVSGPAGQIRYLIEVATDPGMSNRVAAEEVFAGNGRSSLPVPHELAPSTRHYWRVRAFDHLRVGDWSSIWSFTTPAIIQAPPPPSGGGGGGSTPTPAPNDELNVNSIIIAKGEDIRGWAVTSTVISAAHIGDDICVDHTKAGRWPVLPWFDSGSTVEGNQWFFANIGGQWYGGANEWLRPGQTCKLVDGHVGAGGFGGTAMANWTPAPGELIGVAVSTPARAGQWGTAERSNIVLIRW